MSKLVVYSLDDIIDDEKNIYIKANNAFIYPNGNFVLAKGYDARNATYLLEQSANEINKSYTGEKNLLEGYRKFIRRYPDARKFYYLRDILIHFYGFVLFASTDSIVLTNPMDNYFENVIIPEKAYFSKSITIEQLTTLKSLYFLNSEDISDEDVSKLVKLELKKVDH